MAPRVDLKKGEAKNHVAKALKSIRDGYVIVLPAEHGYIYVADAFSHFAVRAMHVLRGDELGVSAQVLCHSAQTVQGITREVSDETTKLMDEFWPGLLSLNLKPNRGLNWDLGDDNALDLVSIRVPKSRFLRALLKESGPLVGASASAAGQAPLLGIDRTDIKSWDVATVFDNGALKSGQPTTVIEQRADGIHIVREGAISAAQVRKIAPSVSGP
jgi:tRNA threonylcarbamoyl adenosine modification protein (Sua5/YciO/YrdC/YwlC family)